MTTAHIIILLATGLGAGFTSGLLGVGGAFIMTPVQTAVFISMGVPADIAIKLAFGTSMMVVLPTAISGVWRHGKKGIVWWKAAVVMGCCTLAGAFGGATLSTHLPGAVLSIVFGVVVLASGIRMLFFNELPQVELEPKNNPWLWAAWAIPIGVITGMLGLGGGILAVPVMVLALKSKMHTAVATSLAVMLFTSIGGLTGYIVNGLGAPNLPAYSIGYVNLPVWFLLAVTSIGMAQIGAATTHRLPAKHLRYIFAVVMFYIGLRMLGLFEWLGWPI